MTKTYCGLNVNAHLNKNIFHSGQLMAAKSDCSCKTAGEGFTILAHYQNNYLIEISGLYTRDTLKLHLYPSISQTKSSPGQFISQPKSHCTMHARTKIATSRTYRYTKPIKFRLITNHTVFSVTNHIAAPIHIFPKHLMAIGHVSTRNQISPSEVHPASTITHHRFKHQTIEICSNSAQKSELCSDFNTKHN